jgi:hypothetical protein
LILDRNKIQKIQQACSIVGRKKIKKWCQQLRIQHQANAISSIQKGKESQRHKSKSLKPMEHDMTQQNQTYIKPTTQI